METIETLRSYTFKALLANSVKKFGDRPALALSGQKEFSYKEVNRKVNEFASILSSLGAKRNDKIAIWGTGRPEWGISYFGIVNQKMTAVPLLPDFTENEVLNIFEQCDLKALVVESHLFEKIKNSFDKLPQIVLKLEDFSVLKNETMLKPDNTFPLQDVAVNEDDIASIIYTSGTTGRSKGVVLTNKNLIWCAIQGQNFHRLNKFDRIVSFLPLSHVYEFTIGFTMEMMNGSCVYYLGRPPVVSALLPVFQKVKPTIIVSVPLIMEKIYKNKVLPEINKSKALKTLYKFPLMRKLINKKIGKTLKKTFGGHLEFLGIGGAKVDEKVEKFMKEAKIPYAIGYGLTETSPLIAASGTDLTIPGTIGPVVPGVDLKIINKNEKTGVGQIVVKGENVMKEYYNLPELTKESFTTKDDECGEGYFKTGDLGLLKKIKGKERLILKGRSKNMILSSSGENIYPEDIETVLNQHPIVNESLVVEDDKGLVALVQYDEEKLLKEIELRLNTKLSDKIPDLKPVTLEELKEKAIDSAQTLIQDILYQKEVIANEIQYFVNSKINKNSRISRIQQIGEFQKTASQKIKRFLYDFKSKNKSKK